jgi:hypothetical protein
MSLNAPGRTSPPTGHLLNPLEMLAKPSKAKIPPQQIPQRPKGANPPLSEARLKIFDFRLFPQGKQITASIAAPPACDYDGRVQGQRGFPMNRIAFVLFLLSSLFVSQIDSAFAHGGGLDRNGCHHDRKRGGYHCH